MAKFCVKCGAELTSGDIFCRKCGTKIIALPETAMSQTNGTVPPVFPSSTFERAHTPEAFRGKSEQRAKTFKTKKSKLSTGLAVGLSALMLIEFCVAGWKYPGWFIKNKKKTSAEPEQTEEIVSMTDGLSGIVFDKSAYETEPDTAMVSSDVPEVGFDNGVKVSFGDYCLSAEEQEIELRSLGNASDEGYEAQGYDFLLDNSEAEFCGLARLTLPYDQSWGDNVFVQYMNEETGQWEIMYAEPNGDGTVDVWTDHFCTYAVFKEKVEKGYDATGSVLTEFKLGGNEQMTYVAVNWDVLATKVRNDQLLAEGSLNEILSQQNTYFVDRSITTLGNLNTGMDYLAKLSNMPGLSNKVLGPLGQAITVGKFFYQGHKYGWGKSIKNNWKDIAAMGVGTLSTAPPPVGTVARAACLAYFIYSTTDAVVTEIENGFFDTKAEKAYRDFTKKYLIYNRKTGRIGARYVKDVIEDANTPHQKDWDPLPCGASDADNANWLTVMQDAIEVGKRGRMTAYDYMNMVVDYYVEAFWGLPDSFRNRYIKEQGYSGYEAPDTDTRDLYIRNMKASLCAWLKPYYDIILEKAYQDNLNTIWACFTKLEKEMNAEYTVQLRVDNNQYLTGTPYEGHLIGLATDVYEPISIYLDHVYGNVTFTGAYWMKCDFPSVLRVTGSKSNSSDLNSNIAVQWLKLKPGNNLVQMNVNNTATTTTTAAAAATTTTTNAVTSEEPEDPFLPEVTEPEEKEALVWVLDQIVYEDKHYTEGHLLSDEHELNKGDLNLYIEESMETNSIEGNVFTYEYESLETGRKDITRIYLPAQVVEHPQGFDVINNADEQKSHSTVINVYYSSSNKIATVIHTSNRSQIIPVSDKIPEMKEGEKVFIQISGYIGLRYQCVPESKSGSIIPERINTLPSEYTKYGEWKY